MGFFDFLAIKSKEQMERERKEFEERVIPLGEEQKQKASDTLARLIPRKNLALNEKMFAFISTKDRFILSGSGDDGLEQAKKMLKKQKWIKPEEKNIILALVQLESRITELEEYPTDEEILALAKAMEN